MRNRGWIVAVALMVGFGSGCSSSTDDAALIPTTSTVDPTSPPPEPTTTVPGAVSPPAVTEFREPCPVDRTEQGGMIGLEDLANHEATWQASRPPSYRYQLDVNLGLSGSPPTIVTVTDGQSTPASTTFSPDRSGFDDLTIDSWFAYLHRLDAGEIDQPDAILVTWDTDRGFPAAIQLDPVCNAIDDESVFTLHAFAAL